MKTHSTVWRMRYYENGWIEIRESDNRDGWLATDSPVEVLD
jgi:hypothetical protein